MINTTQSWIITPYRGAAVHSIEYTILDQQTLELSVKKRKIWGEKIDKFVFLTSFSNFKQL